MADGGQVIARGCMTVANYFTCNQLQKFGRVGPGRAVRCMPFTGGMGIIGPCVHAVGQQVGHGRISHTEGLSL